VNTEARLRALKIGLIVMAGIAMLAIFPAQRLPNYIPGEVPDASAARRKKNEQPNNKGLRGGRVKLE